MLYSVLNNLNHSRRDVCDDFVKPTLNKFFFPVLFKGMVLSCSGLLGTDFVGEKGLGHQRYHLLGNEPWC